MQKECIPERTIQVMVEARQSQNGSERGSRFMLGSQRSHCHDRTNLGVVDSTEPRASGGKDKCQVPLDTV